MPFTIVPSSIPQVWALPANFNPTIMGTCEAKIGTHW